MKLDACVSTRVEWASDMNWTIECIYMGMVKDREVHSSRQDEWKVAKCASEESAGLSKDTAGSGSQPLCI